MKEREAWIRFVRAMVVEREAGYALDRGVAEEAAWLVTDRAEMQSAKAELSALGIDVESIMEQARNEYHRR